MTTVFLWAKRCVDRRICARDGRKGRARKMKQEDFTEYKLDFTGVTSRDELHDLLARVLELPEYYGRNLDALYDCLIQMPLCMISLYHIEALECLGDYALSFAETMEDAAAENLRLIMIYVNGDLTEEAPEEKQDGSHELS